MAMLARWMFAFVVCGVASLASGREHAPAEMDELVDALAAYDRGDYAAALPVFLAWADAGESGAQVRVAAMFAAGQGVAQDARNAVYWLRLAAAQGNKEAMKKLAAVYATGNGAPQDLVRSRMWSNLAAAPGEALDLRAGIAVPSGATPVETAEDGLAEVERMTRDCLASGYKQCGEPSERPSPPATHAGPARTGK